MCNCAAYVKHLAVEFLMVWKRPLDPAMACWFRSMPLPRFGGNGHAALYPKRLR